MQRELFIAISAGLGGMFGWGLADFFAKKTIDRVGSIVSLVWAHVFGTLAFALILLYQLINNRHVNIPGSINEWGLLLLFGILQAIVYLLVYQGFSKGKLALLNPVFASYSGLTAFISIVALGEIVNLNRLITLAVIFSGIILLNIDPEALRLKRLNIVIIPGLKEVVLAAILAAIWTLSWDRFIGGKDWLSYAFLMYAFMTLTAFTIAKLQNIKLSINKPYLWKFLVLIGVCEVVAYLAISLGFSATSLTSIVALLSGSFSLPTIILARVFLKEDLTKIQTTGTLIIIAGIIILSLQ